MRLKKNSERTYIIEQIFDSWEEYKAYYEESSKIFSGKKKKGILKRSIRKYFEIEFKPSLKLPRYYYPENSEKIVLQMSSKGKKGRVKEEKVLKLLDEHQHVVGTTEIYIRDQFAMRMKLMNAKISIRKSTSKSKKSKAATRTRRSAAKNKKKARAK